MVRLSSLLLTMTAIHIVSGLKHWEMRGTEKEQDMAMKYPDLTKDYVTVRMLRFCVGLDGLNTLILFSLPPHLYANH